MDTIEKIERGEFFPPPEKPSDILRMGLDDLEKVEADPRFKVHMADWWREEEGFCRVCFAGSVMAKTLDTPVGAGMTYEDIVGATGPYRLEWQRAFGLLNAIRKYDFTFLHSGYRFQLYYIHLLYQKFPAHSGSYLSAPEKFKTNMRKIVESLREIEKKMERAKRELLESIE